LVKEILSSLLINEANKYVHAPNSGFLVGSNGCRYKMAYSHSSVFHSVLAAQTRSESLWLHVPAVTGGNIQF